MVGQGIGASLLRKEDDPRGRGEFVADIRLAGPHDLAFVRSPVAHARIRGMEIAPQYKVAVFRAADLEGVKPIRAVSGLPGFKASDQPILAFEKVRQVGELIV
jgi:carbon-monoxide dehydrogenase large subunit